MGMMRQFTASSNSTGTMEFKMDDVGFLKDEGRAHVYMGDTPVATWDIQISDTATVTIQGNEGNPDVAGDWYDIHQSATASAVVKDDRHTAFMRVNVDSLSSGTVDVRFAASGH